MDLVHTQIYHFQQPRLQAAFTQAIVSNEIAQEVANSANAQSAVTELATIALRMLALDKDERLRVQDALPLIEALA